MTKLILLFILLSNIAANAQQIQLDTVRVISNAGDTVQAEKGIFFVKENRRKPSSDSIKLAFIRLKSTNPNPGAPIVYLAGGPGGAGSSALSGDRFELFMKLREVADVIAFDQRGTGLSERLPECPYRGFFDVGRAVYKDEYIEKTIQQIEKCQNYWEDKEIDLTAYNTTESAKDIESLRQLLNTEKISIWGISYGSQLAFEYIRLFERHVDKMVLASLEGPAETIKFPTNTENFLYKIADVAESNGDNTTGYPDLKKKMEEVHEKLKEKPATATFKDRNGKTVLVKLSNFELQLAISSFFLKNPKDIASLPQLYNQMYAGNFDPIAEKVWIVKKYFFSRLSPMPFAMDMHSGVSPERAHAIRQQMDRTILGSTINLLQFEWMQRLDFPTLPKEYRTMRQNNVNALLLSGTLDGRTYLTSAIEIAKKFNNGQHVIIENAGHNLFMSSPIIGDLILNFLKDRNTNVTRIELVPPYFK